MMIHINHPTDRPNFSEVVLPNIRVYFSYRTPIAYTTNGTWVVRRNEWGATTGKHLNYIDGGAKAERVDGQVFLENLSKALGRTTTLPNGMKVWMP